MISPEGGEESVPDVEVALMFLCCSCTILSSASKTLGIGTAGSHLIGFAMDQTPLESVEYGYIYIYIYVCMYTYI